jgi:low affinity Fe/Cu permease
VAATIPPTDADQRERQQWVHEHGGSPDNRASRVLAGSPITSSHADSWDRRHWTSRFVHHLGSFAAHPVPAIGAVTLVSAWAVIGMVTRFPVWWQTVLYSVTASVTFVMVFVIQHAQERQTSATQRKLDELIRSSSSADDTLIAVEEMDDGHLQALTSLNYADRQRATEDSR